MRKPVSRPVFALLACMAVGAVLPLVDGACAPGPSVRLKRVELRSELIGGPRALGEVGDWLFENDKVRIIIQDEGFSRGFGVFGGSLIDADLVRTDTGVGTSGEALGRDNFGEMFPAFFLEAMEPYEITNPHFSRCSDDGDCDDGETCQPTLDDADRQACTIDGEAIRRKLPAMEILDDGIESGTAVLAVRGYGNDFLAITQTANEGLLGDSRDLPALVFETRYTLRPGQQYIEIATTVQNIDATGATLPFAGSLAGFEIPTPFGDVVLFGAGNKVFMPHEAGHDLRYRLEKEYATGKEFPALPGLVSEYIASKGDEVSYGLMAAPPDDVERNFAYHVRDQFPEAQPHSVHVPFVASAFTGVFQVLPPALLGNDGRPGGEDEFTFTRYFMVGHGDVASITEVAMGILGEDTGELTGELTEAGTRDPVGHASVFVLDDAGAKVTQMSTDNGGRFRAGALRPGRYTLVPVDHARHPGEGVEVEVVAGKTTHQLLTVDALATIAVTVTEPGVGRVPAKVSIVGTYDAANAGVDPKTHLFDLSLGEPIYFTDMVDDEADDASTRQYLEAFEYTANGVVDVPVRPGTYTVYVSRGLEYGRFDQANVTVEPGQTLHLSAELERQVDTTDYIAADFHLHTVYSLDSHHPLDEAITGYAAEGVEFAVSTDHNFVVDYTPVIADLGLEQHINSMIGLELTTIDRGHFNGFPLRLGDGRLIPTTEDGALDADATYTPANPLNIVDSLFGADEGGERDLRYGNTIASRTKGSFQWAKQTPGDVFKSMRAMGRLNPECVAENTVDKTTCEDDLLDVIVQVNHPRDSILGYFDQYGVSADDMGAYGVADPLFGPDTSFRPEFHARNFSYDFDAIEVFNGKRFEFIHSFTVPEGTTIDPVSCCPVTPGAVFRELDPLQCDEEVRDCTCTADDTAAQIAAGTCDRVNDVAFPGVMEDWMLLLRSGKRVVGTANSDSHEPSKEEPGYPRTYVKVAAKAPIEVTPDDVVDALKKGDALMTNGPYVSVSVDGAGMGDIATVTGGQATVHVDVQCADWLSVNRLKLFVNGVEVVDTALGQSRNGVRSLSEDYVVDVPEDGFVVVEVSGESNMFPTVFPNEIPPLQFSDVLSAIADFGGGGETLSPELTFPTTPFAITNPVWLDVDGDGEITPNHDVPLPFAEDDEEEVEEEQLASASSTPTASTKNDLVKRLSNVHFAKTKAELRQQLESLPPRRRHLYRRMPAYLWPSAHPRDIRNVFFQFLRHNH